MKVGGEAFKRGTRLVPRVPVIDVTPADVQLLVRLARAHHGELERMLRNVEESEGLDATKWQVRRKLTAEIEAAEDVLVKLEAAAKL